MDADKRAAVCPTADAHGHGDTGRMAGRLFDVDAHNRICAGKTARADVDFVQSVREEFFKLCADRIGVVRADRPHEGAFGQR